MMNYLLIIGCAKNCYLKAFWRFEVSKELLNLLKNCWMFLLSNAKCAKILKIISQILAGIFFKKSRLLNRHGKAFILTPKFFVLNLLNSSIIVLAWIRSQNSRLFLPFHKKWRQVKSPSLCLNLAAVNSQVAENDTKKEETTRQATFLCCKTEIRGIKLDRMRQ